MMADSGKAAVIIDNMARVSSLLSEFAFWNNC